MRVSVRFGRAIGILALVGLAACEEASDTTSFEPVGPELSARSAACDFGRMSQDARSYFPGNGRGSISATVQDLIDEMEDACAEGRDDDYTAAWFEVAGFIEQVLADETEPAGDPADAVSFLNQSVSVLGPEPELLPIFDPCDGLENCLPWDGYDDGLLPNFAAVFGSPDGAWAVLNHDYTDPESVCSSFTNPCDDWMMDDDTWGVEPTTNWSDALWGRTSLLFGYPSGLDSPTSPTGEGVFGDMSAYDWLLIPYPSEFGSAGSEDGSELLVSLCSDELASVGQQQVLQKGSTILTEPAFKSEWCPFEPLPTPTVTAGESFFERLASFLSPLPAPLNAVSALGKGPGAGGLAGSFTDFYGVDIPTEAVIRIPAQPADGTVDSSIMAVGGGSFRVVTETSSMQTPLENAWIEIEVIGNSGLIPADGSVSGEGLDCPAGSVVCSGFTQADEDDHPGTLELPLIFTKTGQYSLCLTAELGRLEFERVCTEKFNIRP